MVKKIETFEVEFEKKRGELSEIFTPAYVEAVKSACRKYLSESEKGKPGIKADGNTLLEIAKRTRELRGMLEGDESAIERIELFALDVGEYNFISWFYDLKRNLRRLETLCSTNPASEWIKSHGRGKPPGERQTAERRLAFMLWELYRQAHGKPAGRIVSKRDVEFTDDPDKVYVYFEVGPLVRAAEILQPLLGLRSNLAWHFRKIK
jgi:hypothetical protein